MLHPVKLLAASRFINHTIDREHELCELADIASALFSVAFTVIAINGFNEVHANTKFPKKELKSVVTAPLYQHLTSSDKKLIIENAAAKKSIAKQTLTIKKHKVNFYASIPLIAHDGYHAGNLLLMDHKPQQFKKYQKQLLKTVSKMILDLIAFDHSLHIIKQQHAEARDAEVKLRSFFDSSASCHLLIGKALEVIVFNRNMAEFMESHRGITLYPGINVDKILHGAHLKDFITDYEKALKGIPVKYEREVDYSGKPIWWQVTFEPCYNNEDEIVGISYNATNIEERKQFEQKILDQNHSFKAIAHIQSHELRKPVASILGLMYIFKYAGYKASTEELMMMERAVNELDEKIREIVKISTTDN